MRAVFPLYALNIETLSSATRAALMAARMLICMAAANFLKRGSMLTSRSNPGVLRVRTNLARLSTEPSCSSSAPASKSFALASGGGDADKLLRPEADLESAAIAKGPKYSRRPTFHLYSLQCLMDYKSLQGNYVC